MSHQDVKGIQWEYSMLCLSATGHFHILHMPKENASKQILIKYLACT
jgi:hypothetical protein